MKDDLEATSEGMGRGNCTVDDSSMMTLQDGRHFYSWMISSSLFTSYEAILRPRYERILMGLYQRSPTKEEESTLCGIDQVLKELQSIAPDTMTDEEGNLASLKNLLLHQKVLTEISNKNRQQVNFARIKSLWTAVVKEIPGLWRAFTGNVK